MRVGERIPHAHGHAHSVPAAVQEAHCALHTHTVCTTPSMQHTPCWGLQVSQQSWVQPWAVWVPGGPAAWCALGTFHGAKGEQGGLALSCC